MRKITAFSSLLFILVYVSTPAYALGLGASVSSTRSGKIANVDTKVSDLKARADKEIDRRITSLNDAVSRIDAMKKLSDSQKSQYKTNIQNEITNLQNLKTKIDADTDLTTLRADVQSIVKDYRVYLVYLPQTRILSAADRITTTADLLTSESSSLSAKITEAKNSGKDTTTDESLLSDMNSKISDAKTQAQNAINAVSSLTPQGYPGNKANLDQGRADIKTAVSDLIAAHKDALQIKQDLK